MPNVLFYVKANIEWENQTAEDNWDGGLDMTWTGSGWQNQGNPEIWAQEFSYNYRPTKMRVTYTSSSDFTLNLVDSSEYVIGTQANYVSGQEIDLTFGSLNMRYLRFTGANIDLFVSKIEFQIEGFSGDWVTYLDNTYWESDPDGEPDSTDPSIWHGDPDNYWETGFANKTVYGSQLRLKTGSSWANGFRPRKLKVTWTGGSSCRLELKSTEPASIYDSIGTIMTSPAEVWLGWGSNDIDYIRLVNNDDGHFNITNIEFRS